MKLKFVQFRNNVSFGGQLQSASISPVGDRPGQGGMEIDLDEKANIVRLRKPVNGIMEERFVPMSNIASFQPLPVEKK